MKNIILKINILLAVFLLLIVNSCVKDEKIDASDEEQNRSFMAVFRYQANTGNASDPFACKVVNTNDMYLTWNAVNGAIGYRIQMKIQSGSWDIPVDILLDTIVGPEVLKMTIEDLQYSTLHNFAIQALSPMGEKYNSKWYGKGDTGHNDDRASWTMGIRLYEPYVVYLSDVTETSVRVWFALDVNTCGVPIADLQKTTFQWDSNSMKFLIDEVVVEPASDNRELPSQRIKLTEQDIANGYVDVTGLTSNAVYIVNGLNNLVARKWDKLYNTNMVRMKGVVGAPILIPHIVDTSAVAKQYNASRLDTILRDYILDNTLAEGTILELEAGKAYYFGAAPILAKGFTLRSSDPNNKAIVYMGLGWSESNPLNPNAFNFFLGRNAAPGEIGGILVGDIIFSDISFSVPFAYNYFNKPADKNIAANYFVNQYPAAMPFTCSKFEVRNCNFQGMVRGFFRNQGSNRQNIDNIIIDNCLFHDDGMYSSDGRGYSFIAGAATNPRTNIFNNVVIKNTSFVGISYDKLLNEAGNYAWINGLEWHITIENNTFLNAFNISSGRYLVALNYPPANSRFTIRKNLFIAVKSAGDDRVFYQAGMNFTAYNPGVTFNVEENYSTSQTSADGTVTYWSGSDIFTLNPFSSTSKGAGYQGGIYNDGGAATLPVKTGVTPIAPENLMADPFPKGKKVGTVWDTNSHLYNLEGLKYKTTTEVQNHEIYINNIGDPRWR